MIDWPSYNESLVRRGQVLLDFDVLDGLDHELSQMNLGKLVDGSLQLPIFLYISRS
jgi:hypothetical protein